MFQSNFTALGNGPGNLEVIARVGDRLVGFFRPDQPPLAWQPASAPTFQGVTGNPALIQSRFGSRGNFELVVPLAGGGLGHFFRDNDAPGLPWSNQPVAFGSNLGSVDAVSLIQGNFTALGNGPGNLEVIARVGDRLVGFFRPDQPPLAWQPASAPTFQGVTGNPALIQSHFGSRGNFELVVPLAGGGLGHFFRDNDAPGLPWSNQPVVFGSNLGSVDAVSLIQSNFSASGSGPGNLEVIARVGNQLFAFFRPDQPPFQWQSATAPSL
jgi:hypothetical protein